MLGRLAERSPVLLIVEDIHHADAATRARVVPGPHRPIAPSRIVGTYQADAIRREDPWALDLVGLAAAPRPPADAHAPTA